MQSLFIGPLYYIHYSKHSTNTLCYKQTYDSGTLFISGFVSEITEVQRG